MAHTQRVHNTAMKWKKNGIKKKKKEKGERRRRLLWIEVAQLIHYMPTARHPSRLYTQFERVHAKNRLGKIVPVSFCECNRARSSVRRAKHYCHPILFPCTLHMHMLCLCMQWCLCTVAVNSMQQYNIEYYVLPLTTIAHSLIPTYNEHIKKRRWERQIDARQWRSLPTTVCARIS